MKIHPVGAELLQTDRHDKAHSCFSQFCERTSQLVQRVNERGKRAGDDHWFSDRKLSSSSPLPGTHTCFVEPLRDWGKSIKNWGGGGPKKMWRPKRSRCLYNEGGQLVEHSM